MSRPRKPTELLEATGAFKHNPNRLDARMNEPQLNKGVGNPPTHLTKAEKKVWKELARDVFWLKVTDRLALEMVCKLTATMRTTPEKFTGTQTSALTALVRTLGLTPSDRARINAPQPEKEDEWTSLLAPVQTREQTPLN